MVNNSLLELKDRELGDRKIGSRKRNNEEMLSAKKKKKKKNLVRLFNKIYSKGPRKKASLRLKCTDRGVFYGKKIRPSARRAVDRYSIPNGHKKTLQRF